MSYSDLVDFFGAHTNFPIQINDIRDWCLGHTHQDEIEFHEVEMDTEVSWGQLYQFTRHEKVYADPRYVSYITVAADLTDCEKRFVLCKEMTHLTDDAYTRTKTREQLDKLTKELSGEEPLMLRPSLRPSASFTDILAIYKAFAILAPLDALERFKEKHNNGEVSDMDIAEAFKIPVFYVPKLLSDTYSNIYNELLYA